MTDEAWSSPVQLLDADSVQTIGAFRPAQAAMDFGILATPMLAWADRLEQWCTSQPHLDRPSNRDAIETLRRIVKHTESQYAPGRMVEELVMDLRNIGFHVVAPLEERAALPPDPITQHYPGESP